MLETLGIQTRVKDDDTLSGDNEETLPPVLTLASHHAQWQRSPLFLLTSPFRTQVWLLCISIHMIADAGGLLDCPSLAYATAL
jgi:hypothetical protein